MYLFSFSDSSFLFSVHIQRIQLHITKFSCLSHKFIKEYSKLHLSLNVTIAMIKSMMRAENLPKANTAVPIVLPMLFIKTAIVTPGKGSISGKYIILLKTYKLLYRTKCS